MVISRLWRIQTVLYGGVVLKLSRVNPLSPNIHMYILLTVLHTFLVTSWENLIKHQHISCLVIISFVLMTMQ